MSFFGITALGPPSSFQAGLVSALGINVFSVDEFEATFRRMDKDGSGVMSLLEFAQLMSTLSERSSKDQKLRLTFEVYDHDRHDKLTPSIRTINP